MGTTYLMVQLYLFWEELHKHVAFFVELGLTAMAAYVAIALSKLTLRMMDFFPIYILIVRCIVT